jgi:glucokinase
VGVDVGGTKIQASLVERDGRIAATARRTTPARRAAEQTLDAVLDTVAKLLAREGVPARRLRALGLAVPGVVDPDKGRVVVTPNMNLTGLVAGPLVRKRFGVPTVVGNDVNLGMLGEKWLGAAQQADSAVGIFVGTGIGGGVILNGRLLRGAREAAGEIGHMVMQAGGPLCGCGNRGCLEALASRTAIERDIRTALKAGRRSMLRDMIRTGEEPLRSKVLRRALRQGDKLAAEVVGGASETLGYACLTIRHVLDPDVIVLGGGVIEACWRFMLPIVEDIMARDALPGARPGGYVARSELGDDAVVLGAVALARQSMGDDPLARPSAVVPRYPRIAWKARGEVTVDGEVHKSDVCVRGDGKVRTRDAKAARPWGGGAHAVVPAELIMACHGRPSAFFLGTGEAGSVALTPEGERFLQRRGIRWRALPSPQAVAAYNRARGRKAILLHVTC